ncbi:MAG TPA: DUF2203 domain-containing protein, partial [Acidobacteriaceae bacterium]|nr:DUF2203 domain-containing protein [Acidobacteriaceae bacterium]
PSYGREHCHISRSLKRQNALTTTRGLWAEREVCHFSISESTNCWRAANFPYRSPTCGRIGAEEMSARTFTLDEAQMLLPVLESLLRNAISGKQLMEEVEGEMQELSHRIFLNGGTHVDVVAIARRKAERTKAEQRAKDALAEIDSIGVQVKDIDIGLLDFPCEVEGSTVLLCWKMGEKSITHWHGQEEGFAGRKLIDERIARSKRTN